MKTTTTPEKAYAFSVFAKTRPVLIEVSALLDDPFKYMEEPYPALASHIGKELLRLPKPPNVYWTFKKDIDELESKLENPSLGKTRREKIQQEIMEKMSEAYRPEREHRIRIDRLAAALPDEIEAFKDWIANDPEGIAAAAQDKAFHEWEKAERQRQADDEREARRREKIRRDIEELQIVIGPTLTTLDIGHTDIDSEAARDFLEWHNRRLDQSGDHFFQTNAILTGPSGTGKTRALAQAAVWYAREYRGMDSVEWITGYDFAELVSDLATDKRQESSGKLAQITFAEILYFDDLGSANFTPARTSRFFRLIDERYKHDLPTIFTTNYTTAQLKKLFATTSETRDEATRILRRIIGTPAAPLAKFFHFKRPTTTAENAN